MTWLYFILYNLKRKSTRGGAMSSSGVIALWQELREYYKKYKDENTRVTIERVEVTNRGGSMYRGKHFKDIPVDFRERIEDEVFSENAESREIYKIIIFSSSGRKVTLFWFDGCCPFCPPEEDPLLFRRLVTGINYLLRSAVPCCPKNIHVYLFLLDAPKEMEIGDGEPIDWPHVNTGFCYPCPGANMTGEIYVYRAEEWMKVFFHELIHLAGIDFARCQEDIFRAEELLRREFYLPAEFPVNLVEAMTETLAELVWFSVATAEKVSSWREFSREVLHRQKLFSCQQAAHVLVHGGVRSYPLGRQLQTYQEKTSALSYYFFRSIFLWNIDNITGGDGGFEKVFGGRSLIAPMRSCTDEGSLLSMNMATFLVRASKNRKYSRCLSHFLQESYTLKNQHAQVSMRMTCPIVLSAATT